MDLIRRCALPDPRTSLRRPTSFALVRSTLLSSFEPESPTPWPLTVYELVRCEGANGSRTIVNYNPLTEMSFEEFRSVYERYGPVDWAHFEGRNIETIRDILPYLRSKGVKISLECEKPDREGLEELIPLADVLFFSKTWALVGGSSFHRHQ